MNLINLFGVFSVISYLAYFILFALLHRLNKEYNYKQHALSDYAHGSTKNIFLLYSIVGNIGAFFLAFNFILLQKSGEIYLKIGVFLLLMILCRILLTVFKTNIEGSRLTINGFFHYLFAIGNFAFLYMIIDISNSHVLNQINFIPSYIISIYGILVTIILILVCITMFKPLRMFFGVIERAYILITVFWFLIVSLIFMFHGKI